MCCMEKKIRINAIPFASIPNIESSVRTISGAETETKLELK